MGWLLEAWHKGTCVAQSWARVQSEAEASGVCGVDLRGQPILASPGSAVQRRPALYLHWVRKQIKTVKLHPWPCLWFPILSASARTSTQRKARVYQSQCQGWSGAVSRDGLKVELGWSTASRTSYQRPGVPSNFISLLCAIWSTVWDSAEQRRENIVSDDR